MMETLIFFNNKTDFLFVTNPTVTTTATQQLLVQ